MNFGRPGLLASLYLSLPEGTSITLNLHGRSFPESGSFEGPLSVGINPLRIAVKESPYELQLNAVNSNSSDQTIKILCVFATFP